MPVLCPFVAGPPLRTLGGVRLPSRLLLPLSLGDDRVEGLAGDNLVALRPVVLREQNEVLVLVAVRDVDEHVRGRELEKRFEQLREALGPVPGWESATARDPALEPALRRRLASAS